MAIKKKGLFKGPKTLSIIPTYTCTAECRDCGTFSSPRDHTCLGLETILAAIDQAKELGFYNIVFTGGESTLRWKDLLTSIEYAHSIGFPTRIVTNAHWATSMKRANEYIDELIKVGLSEINYSTGDEHTRFVPIEHIINATVAALERNLRVCIMIELKAERKITMADILEHPMITSLKTKQRKLLQVSEGPWMRVNPFSVEQYPEDIVINKNNVAMCTGCDSVLQTYVSEANGRIGACCGLGMRIIPELNIGVSQGKNFLKKAIEDSENDFLKVWLYCKGPEKILAWAAEKNPEIKWENMYAHRCQACLRLYKDPKVAEVIREYYTEMISDVLQSLWLETELIPEKLSDSVKLYRRYDEVDCAQ